MYRHKMALAFLVVVLSGFLVLGTAIQIGAMPAASQSAAVGQWQLVMLPSTQSAYALDMMSADEGWAGGAAGFMFSYDGEWRGVPTSFQSNINGISMVNSTDGWAVTWQGQFIHWNGSEWSVVGGTPDVGVLDDVLMLDGANGWAVGGGGTIVRYANGAWQVVSSPVGSQLKDVDMLNPNDGWAVGLVGTIARWNGSTWLGGTIDTGGWGFYGVDIVDHEDVWAVGGGGMIYHYTASGWQEVSSPTEKTLNSIVMVGPGNGWAVGEDGVIIHYNGVAWELVDSPTTTTLNKIDAVSAEDVWAVGRVGVTVHYTVAYSPDLGPSTLTVDKRNALAGDTLSYSLTLQNVGQAPASNVVVSDTLDLSLVTLVPGSLVTSQGTSQEGNPLLVDVGDVVSGTTVTIGFDVTVVDQGLPAWFVPNQAIIQGDNVYLTRAAVTTIGTPYTTYIPLTVRNTPATSY
ncbi:MAG: hypothetical protein P8129_02055 [Anaerolineae bacterium]